MVESFEPGALLGHVYTLEDGCRVRLRLTRPSDAAAIGELLADQGFDPSPVQIARLVQFDPRHRYVICAAGLVGHSERVLGVGAIEVEPDASGDPDFLIVDDAHAGELGRLLTRALVATAAAFARLRAA